MKLINPSFQFVILIKNMMRKMTSPRILRKFFIGLLIGILTGFIVTHKSTLPCDGPQEQLVKDSSEFEPKLVEPNPSESFGINKIRNKFSVPRPRYYTTELGVRKKLFVGVVSYRKFVPETFAAINKTLNLNIDTLAFFSPKSQDILSTDLILHQIVNTGKQSFLILVLELIAEKYLENYDYIFLVKDDVYIQGNILRKFVAQISTSHDVFAGGYINGDDICSFKSGMVFSNSVFRSLVKATKDVVTLSEDEDQLISELVKSSTGLTCANYIKTDIDAANLITRARNNFSIYPISTANEMYKLHIESCRKELNEAEAQKSKFHTVILEMNKRQADAQKLTSWPIGSEDNYMPRNRFDLIHWQHFNSSHMFFPNEVNVIKRLRGSDRLDIGNVVEYTKAYMKAKYPENYHFNALLNGYRKIDLTRGADYLLDFEFCDSDSKTCSTKRVNVFRGLSKMEFMNVPYVTENVIVTLVIPILPKHRGSLQNFFVYFAKVLSKNGGNLRVVFVFIKNSNTGDIYRNIKVRLGKLQKKFERTGTRIIFLEFILPGIVRPPQVLIMDLIGSRLSSNALIIYGHPEMILKEDFLNRVRMNTISGFQVFFPVPFVQYNPNLIYRDQQISQCKIGTDYGHYDRDSYDYAGFYYSDYLKGRRLIISDVPMIRKQKDIYMYSDILIRVRIELINIFLMLQDIHIFRAVDKALCIHFSSIECEGSFDAKCLSRRARSHGNQKQLALFYLKNLKGI